MKIIPAPLGCTVLNPALLCMWLTTWKIAKVLWLISCLIRILCILLYDEMTCAISVFIISSQFSSSACISGTPSCNFTESVSN